MGHPIKKTKRRRDKKGRYLREGEEFAGVFANETGNIFFLPIQEEADSKEANQIASSWGLKVIGFGIIIDEHTGVIASSLPLQLDPEGKVLRVW